MASKEEKLQALHKTALEEFEVIQTKEKNNRNLAIEDSLFINAEDGQWDEDAATKRADRPRYTIDKVSGAVDQLVGNQRQNRTSIKVRPASGAADEDTAKIYDGLIRNIESQSKATSSYDSAYDEAVTGGYGGFRILTQFNDDDSFEQDIRIKGIPSAASSLWFDCSATEYDKRDAKHAFVTSFMGKEEFKAKYPNATETDFTHKKFSESGCLNWFKDDDIMVAEYWKKIPVTRSLALLSDGRIIDKDEEQKVLDEIAGTGITIVKERQATSFNVVHYKMNGAEILEGPKKWAGKFIPLVPVYGRCAVIEGKSYIRGLVRKAKDPQRVYNYTTSAAVEASALTPKDPYWITPAQALGHEAALKTFNQKNDPFMFFNNDTEAPGAPQRTGAPSVQTAIIQQTQQAASDIEATTGIYAPALGNAPQLLSEKSVMNQAEKGDRGSFVFEDNLQKSIQYAGDILVDLLPRIMDTPRISRILNIDGTSEMIGINQEALDDFNQPIKDEQSGQVVIVNDLAKGKYETVVETGKAFTTLQQESASQLIELMDVPAFEGLTADLLAKNLPILESEELSKRVRKNMISQGIVEPTEDEVKELKLDQPQEPNPAEVALTDNVLMQNAKLESEVTINDQKAESETVKQYNDAVKAYDTLMDTFTKQVALGIPLGQVEQQARQDALGLIEVARDNAKV